MSKDSEDLAIYKDVAFSDFVLFLSAVRSAVSAYRSLHDPYLAFSFACVAAASGVGVLRFAWKPRVFARLNFLLAQFAGTVGVPFIILSVVPAAFKPALLTDPQVFLGLLIGIFSVSFFFLSVGDAWKIMKLINVACVVLNLYASYSTGNLLPAIAAIIFVAGSVIGPKRHSRIFGERRENIFHYLTAASLYVFERAAHGKPLLGFFYI